MRIMGFEIKWVGFGTSVNAQAKKCWRSTGEILPTVKLIRDITGWTIHESHSYFKKHIRGY